MRFALLILLWPCGAFASAADVCAEAASAAASRHGVPYDLMMAVARVESGRDTDLGFMPWPWTINQAGAGTFYGTQEELKAKAQDLAAAGQSNFDLGCFQVNYGWHAENFASLDAMLDPETNADYAAALLKRLYDAKGDWLTAAGAYHSETDDKAKAYIAKVEAALGQPVDPATAPEVSRSGLTEADADWFLRDGLAPVAAMGSLVRLACSDCEALP